MAIPNIFHFVFGFKEQTEPFHLAYYLCLASCIQVNRPDKVYFHYYREPHGEWWERIKLQLELRRIEPETFVAGYRYANPRIDQFRYAHLADFTRMQILFEEGGIYADIDTLFLRPFPSSWRLRQFILGEERPPAGAVGSLCNAWIASAPGAEFCRLWLEQMHGAFDGTWSNHSTLLPYRLSREFPHLIDIEGATSFYSVDYTPRSIDKLFLGDGDLPENAYSLHLWEHLWWDSKRVDFSHFHAGLLTVDYVAFAQTTYARHARRFLPEGVPASLEKFRWQTAMTVLRHPLRSALFWLSRA